MPRKKGFWKVGIELGTKLMLIVSELGEALEADRKALQNRSFYSRQIS